MGKSKEKKDCCKLDHESTLYHSRYIKIILFVVTLGCFPSGMAIYWELIVLYSRYTHVSMQLMFLLAVILGAVPAGIIVPHVGRTGPLIYSTLLFYPAITINALYQGHHVCDLGARILSGIAIGAYLTIAIIYVGELPLARYRNRHYAILSLGYFCGGAIYALLFYINAWFSLVFLIFPFLYLILALIYLPETPFYVMQIQKDAFASEVLYFLRCGSVDLQNIEIEDMRRFIFGSTCLHQYGMADRCLTFLILVCFTFFTGFPLYLLIARAATYYISYTLIVVFSVLGWSTYYCISEKRSRSSILLISASGMFMANIFLVLFFGVLESIILFYFTLIVFFYFYFLGFAEMWFTFLGESFAFRAKHYSCAFGVVVYFITFSFGCFLMREFMLGVGPLLTGVYFLINNFLSLLFAGYLMPKYKRVNLIWIGEYYDGIDLL